MNTACKNIVNDQDFHNVYKIFNVLSNPIRLKIIYALANDEHTTSDIIDSVGTGQSNISQQLSKLYDAKLIKRRREKNIHKYSLQDERVLELLQIITRC